MIIRALSIIKKTKLDKLAKEINALVKNGNVESGFYLGAELVNQCSIAKSFVKFYNTDMIVLNNSDLVNKLNKYKFMFNLIITLPLSELSIR